MKTHVEVRFEVQTVLQKSHTYTRKIDTTYIGERKE